MQQDRLLTRSRAASAIIACSLLVTRVTSSRVRVCVLIERDENSCKSTRTFKKQGKKRKREKKKRSAAGLVSPATTYLKSLFIAANNQKNNDFNVSFVPFVSMFSQLNDAINVIYYDYRKNQKIDYKIVRNIVY